MLPVAMISSYPHPPGHGRPGRVAREGLGLEEGGAAGDLRTLAEAIVRGKREGEREGEREGVGERERDAQGRGSGGGDEGAYMRDEVLREEEQVQRQREERWEDWRRKHRDSMARAAFGGAGRMGAGRVMVRREKSGEWRSAASLEHMSLPAVFPADLQSK